MHFKNKRRSKETLAARIASKTADKYVFIRSKTSPRPRESRINSRQLITETVSQQFRRAVIPAANFSPFTARVRSRPSRKLGQLSGNYRERARAATRARNH